MSDKIAEIIAFVCVTITSFAVIALLITDSEINKAQNIYCFRKYQNNVLNYQKCMSTRFVKVLREDNQ